MLRRWSCDWCRSSSMARLVVVPAIPVDLLDQTWDSLRPLSAPSAGGG
ncbi:hypothetical protein GDO81_025676 [Engystomops pustulosus]|uniref:Uncharacterized protein n=1 Tax=Engystomops pustulosus TaxID=76066 RepID=A0AAV6Z9Q2_ENGPU|nr:hypothetical protein GDO81_025676 [Engystomops pustulosus]